MTSDTQSKDGFRTIDPKRPTTNSDWYDPDITLDLIPIQTLPVLESTTGLEGQELVDHINASRAKAWQIQPYPCVGIFLFLDLNIASLPVYPTILHRLTSPSRNDERLLDIACGLGQELRKLAFDGVDPGKLYGVDLSQGLIDAGFDLFKDHEGKGGDMTFATGDVFAEDPLASLEKNGKKGFDIIHVGAFLHLFRLPDQILVAKALVSFLSSAPDAVIFGWNLGTVEPGEVKVSPKVQASVFSHSPESWREFWEDLGREMGMKWRVEAVLAEYSPFVKRCGSAQVWGEVYEEIKIMKWSVHRA